MKRRKVYTQIQSEYSSASVLELY